MQISKPISVIICTHNPKSEYLEQVLNGLRNQTLDKKHWKIIVVDNGSSIPISVASTQQYELDFQIISEPRQGLTHARLAGIKNSQSELLVFVDDDNVLEDDYLEEAFKLSKKYNFLGAWGGSCLGEFEIQPPNDIKKHLGLIGIRKIDKNLWSNITGNIDFCPIGAGLVVRSEVANHYCSRARKDESRQSLDRVGTSLGGSGDIDLAYTAIDIDLGIGVFNSLKLKHLIPKNRIEKKYLLELAEQSMISSTILHGIRGAELNTFKNKARFKALSRRTKDLFLMPRFDRKIKRAYERGFQKGLDALEKI